MRVYFRVYFVTISLSVTECGQDCHVCFLYTLPGTKISLHMLLYRWTAFSFDYGAHWPWRHSEKLMQCHNIYLHPELHSFSLRSCIDDGRVGLVCQDFSTTSQRFWTLWWPIHVWQWCLMLPEPLFLNVSSMTSSSWNMPVPLGMKNTKIPLMEKPHQRSFFQISLTDKWFS